MATANTLLAQGIEQDIANCQQLLDLLEQEQTLLADRDFDGLDKLIDQKSRLLIKLDRNALTRSQWVANYQANTKDSPKEAVDAFAEAAKKHGLAEHWFQLQALFKTCHETNEVNGKMMVRNRSTHQRLLNILRGQNNSGQLYNGKGTKHQGLSSSTLGQA